MKIPSGKLTYITMENHIKGPFSIAMLNYQRVDPTQLSLDTEGTQA